MRLLCWLLGHRYVHATGLNLAQRLLDRCMADWPIVYCGRCNPQGRPNMGDQPDA